MTIVQSEANVVCNVRCLRALRSQEILETFGFTYVTMEWLMDHRRQHRLLLQFEGVRS